MLEHLDLAEKFEVGAVPHTVINDQTISRGLEPEERLIAEIVSLQPFEPIQEEAAPLVGVRIDRALVQDVDVHPYDAAEVVTERGASLSALLVVSAATNDDPQSSRPSGVHSFGSSR